MPNTPPAIHESQIGADGRRKSFKELGVDPDAPVDKLGFAGERPAPTVLPIAGTQIDGTTGERKTFEELGIDPEAPVGPGGFAEGAGYKGGDPAPGRDHNGEVIDGGGDEGPTKDELYERATELDIKGRSKMDKEQLAEAIAEAENGGTTAGDDPEATTGDEPAAEVPDGADATPVDAGADATPETAAAEAPQQEQ